MNYTITTLESHKTPLTPALLSTSLGIPFSRDDWYDRKDSVKLAKFTEFRDESFVVFENSTYIGDYNTQLHMMLHTGVVDDFPIIKLDFIKDSTPVKSYWFMTVNSLDKYMKG